MGAELDFDPLLSLDQNPVFGYEELRGLGPFVMRRRAGEEEGIAFHPVYFWLKSGERSERQILFPFIYFERTERGRRSWFFPLYFEHKFRDKEGRSTEGFVVLFLIYGGQHRTEGRYFLFFPIGGNLKGLMGKDEIRVVLFPFYFDTRLGENRAHHILFPFIHFSYGGGKSSFQLWPLYGYSKREGKHTSRFILWPLYTWTKEEGAKGISSFPLFGYRSSEKEKRIDVLYPFFGYRRWKDTRTWKILWPICVLERSPTVNKFYLFPLFGWKTDKKNRSKRFYILYPLFRYSRVEREAWTAKELNLILLFTDYNRSYRSGEKKKYTIFFPFYMYNRQRDGTRSVRAPELIWFRDPRGFQRNYSPLFWLFEYDSSEWRRKTRILWGLFSERKSPNERKVSVSFLFTYRRKGEERAYNFLGGLFGWGKKGGRGYVRIFFVRIGK